MILPSTLRAAVTLAETRHFGRAAERLYLSQPGFSQQISRLERALGVDLFERMPREVRLTPAGVAFVGRARRLLEDLEVAATEARRIGDGSAGELTVGLLGSDPPDLMPLILETYGEAWPDVSLRFVELSLANQFDRLLDKTVDVAFVRAPLRDERILMRPLFAEPRVAALPVRHRLAEAEEVTIEDLLDERFPTAAPPAPPEWRSFWTCDRERGEPCRKAADVHSIGESLAAVAYLNAVDTWPMSPSRAFRHPGVSFVPIQAPYSVLTIAHRSDDDRPGVLAFTELASELARQHFKSVPLAVLPEDAPLGTPIPTLA